MTNPIPDPEQVASLLHRDGTLKVLFQPCCDNCGDPIDADAMLCDRCKQPHHVQGLVLTNGCCNRPSITAVPGEQ